MFGFSGGESAEIVLVKKGDLRSERSDVGNRIETRRQIDIASAGAIPS